jgi:hypothetical protein
VDLFQDHANADVNRHVSAEDDLVVLAQIRLLDDPGGGALPKIRASVSFIEASIQKDILLYLPYIFVTKCFAVAAVPRMVVALKGKCTIPDGALRAFTKHAFLDLGHSRAYADMIDVVAAFYPGYAEPDVIAQVSQIHYDFLEEIISVGDLAMPVLAARR